MTFGVVSLALAAVFASAGTPIPLYNTYRTGNGVSDSALAVATVIYMLVTATSLLVLGRLSDHLGRKPVAIGALLSSVLGLLLLTRVDGLALLIVGRVFQGIACGVAASSLGSFAVDTAPQRPGWLASLVTTSVPTLGVPLGALLSGVLVQSGPAPRWFGYEAVAIVLVLLAAVLAFAPETRPRVPGALRSMRPAVELPAGPRRGVLVAIVAATFVGTWAFSGFYQAFASSMTADHLGTSSSVVIALVFGSIVLLGPVGGAATGRWRPVVAIRAGLVLFLAAVSSAVAGLWLGSITVFLAASLVGGIGMGAASASAMRLLLAEAEPWRRAGLLSSVYLVSYGGAALPGLAAGAFASTVELTVIATGYVGLVLVAVTVAVVASTRLASRAPTTT